MATALEMLRTFCWLALTEKHFTAALLTLCPHSVESIALPLLICGLKAGVVR